MTEPFAEFLEKRRMSFREIQMCISKESERFKTEERFLPIEDLGEWNWANGGRDFAKWCWDESKGFGYTFNLKFCIMTAEVGTRLPVKADRFLKALDCLDKKEVKRRIEKVKG